MANLTPKEMIHEICRDKTEQEWFEVQSILKEYFQSDAPEDDKKQVAQYTEIFELDQSCDSL